LPSRFLFDVDDGLYERIGAVPKELITELTRQTNTNGSGIKNLSAGETVNHSIFGKGDIQSVDKEKGVYNILFTEINKIKPIDIGYNFSLNTDVPVDDNPEESFDTEIQGKTEEAINIPQQERTIDLNEKNLWKRADIPHTGWVCINLIDLGKAEGICEMCGNHSIRYVHIMRHHDYSGTIRAGCICAGRMEGNSEKASQREHDYKNLQNRKMNFLKREWKKSRKGNLYLNYRNINIVLLPDKLKNGHWRYSIGGKVSVDYPTLTEAKIGIFDDLFLKKG
jgi:hypothetical protein